MRLKEDKHFTAGNGRSSKYINFRGQTEFSLFDRTSRMRWLGQVMLEWHNAMSYIVEIMNFAVDLASVVSINKPSGAKGCCEARAIIASLTIINWITIAVEKRNISKLATSDKVWRAIQQLRA